MVEIYNDVGVEIAKLGGVRVELAGAATRIMLNAVALAAESRDTGAYSRSIQTERDVGPKGVTDYVVYSDDPAAVMIEYGHMTRSTKNSPGTFVPGKHILRRAIG